MQKKKIYAVIPAAGLGARMGAHCNKVFLELDGQPILRRTLQVFQGMPEIAGIQLVGREAELTELEAQLLDWQIGKALPVVAGGASRQDSVGAGLRALAAQLSEAEALVLVHDAARCLVSEALIRRCILHLETQGACVAAVPLKDTLKRVAADGQIIETLQRSELWQVQTPQAFRLTELLSAYAWAEQQGVAATDDASLVEAAGGRVFVVEGSYQNIKLTTSEDLALAQIYLESRAEP